MSSNSFSLDIARTIAIGVMLVKLLSSDSFVCGSVQTCVGMVVLVHIHSSNIITFLLCSIANLTSYDRSLACITIFSIYGLDGIFVYLKHFFLILCFLYNYLKLYIVAFDPGNFLLNSYSLSESELTA